MKGKMFVVNSETIQSTVNTQIASIITPEFEGEQWLKTLADIMADMLQIEIGDYIFLWETSNKAQKSRIYGVYRAISKPYYECIDENDNAPFKIHIERAYDFVNPVDEYDVLNCPYIKNEMWTIIGKKVAGKSRGTSPLSSDEIKNLITLLIGKNPAYQFYEFDSNNIIRVSNQLRIDYTKTGIPQKPTSLARFHPNNINYINNGNVHYEKILETIFNQELSDRNIHFFSQLGINVDKVVWYSNYLPYSIEQSEMDYVVIQSDDGICINKIFVIEFQKSKIDEDHIRRCILYTKWINETLAIGVNIAQPIMISYDSYDFIHGETHSAKKRCMEKLNTIINDCVKEYKTNDLQVYTYSIDDEINFKRKR